MRVVGAMLAPLWVPLAGLWIVLVYDSPLIRFITAVVVLLAIRLAWRFLLWLPVAYAFRFAFGRRRY